MNKAPLLLLHTLFVILFLHVGNELTSVCFSPSVMLIRAVVFFAFVPCTMLAGWEGGQCFSMEMALTNIDNPTQGQAKNK